LAVVALILQQLLIEDAPRKLAAEGNPLRLWRFMTPHLRNLLVSDILVRFCEQIPYAFVVIWCVSINKITPLQFGVLTAVEMTTAMLVYLPVAYLADRSTKKPFVVATFFFFMIFPAVLLVARSFWVMVIAFVIRGLKEFGEPTRKALIMDLAPDGRKAATFGVYYLIRDIIVSVAAFGGALLWDGTTAKLIIDTLGIGHSLLPWLTSVPSPATNFLVASGFGFAGLIYFVLFGRDLGRATAEGTEK
jgi:MFS family permease